MKKEDLKKHHSIDLFGILKVSLSNIRIEKLEDRISPGVPFPHKHDFYQVMIVTSGTGFHRIDFKNHKVSPGAVFLMKPGQMHSWDLKKNVKGYIVEFNQHSLTKENIFLVNQYELSPDAFLLPKNDYAELIKLTELMIREFKSGKEMHDICLRAYLTSFLISLIRSYDTKVKPDKSINVIEKFKDLIEKNFKTNHGVEFYAKELGVSSKALTMQLARSIGKPPRTLIQERILLEAKRYLAFSSLGISEIGYELGFMDANYFTRFFRSHEKMTPAKFRKEHA